MNSRKSSVLYAMSFRPFQSFRFTAWPRTRTFSRAWVFGIIMGGAGPVSAQAQIPVTPAADPGVRLEVTRDVWISAFPAEQDGNNGGSSRLKAKGVQEMFLMDADFSRLQGRTVTQARLHVRLESPDAPLRRTTVGTVAVPWVEGGGNSYEKGTGGATFRSPGQGSWAGGPDITAAILGQSGTRWAFGEASAPDAEGWQVIPVDPAVIQDCAAGRSHGVVVMDDVGSEYTRQGDKIDWRLFPNRLVSSREGPKARAPWFEIRTDNSTAPSPPPAVNSGPAAPDEIRPAQPDAAALVKLLPAEEPSASGTEPQSKPSLPPGWHAEDLFGQPLTTLELDAARNEAVCLRLTVPGGTCDVSLPAPFQVSLRRIASVESAPDPLPDLAAPDTGSLLIEIQVPHQAPAGRVTGHMAAGGVSVPLVLTVWNFELPDRLSFVPEMNAYSLPGRQKDELAWYRLAHAHRTCLNVLRYNWRGQVHDGCAPLRNPKDSETGAWSWTAWDQRFGPLLDGSAFAGLPRAGTPVDSIYLPLNENWPMEIEKHFHGGYWADTALDDAYWEQLHGVSREFAAHIRDRGWKDTLFEFYLNNKVYFKAERGAWSACSAPWIFDEPVNTQDFFALREFGRRFNESARPLAANAVFRCDISRPEWQRDLLDGVTGVEVLGGGMRSYADRIRQRQTRWGQMSILYGSAADPGDVLQPSAWSLEAWCLGADGVLPWQTIGTEESWRKKDPLSLFYPTAEGPVPSLRLKSFRWAQQLIEYLTIHRALTGVSRESLAEAVREAAGMRAAPEFEQANAADAGTSRYSKATAASLTKLRHRLAVALDKAAPAPRRQWHSFQPPVHPPTAIPVARLISLDGR
ncbi:MAG: DUF4091 domain-containing protein [Verrucomicrobiaceae bacterium]|nr:MAG: DUF4091 domain-containing protein [Verrucomicrobiaceae bacterium]